jgi:hypothetical protein
MLEGENYTAFFTHEDKNKAAKFALDHLVRESDEEITEKTIIPYIQEYHNASLEKFMVAFIKIGYELTMQYGDKVIRYDMYDLFEMGEFKDKHIYPDMYDITQPEEE